MTTAPSRSAAIADAASRVPEERLSTYARLWDFETWLRTMVYVEFRACYGDSWELHLQRSTTKPHDQDKRLSHMPTREVLPTSYMQLADLLKTISCQWCLFDTYLPPKSIWDAKMLEIEQIRHRVAHFRLGHRHDASRLEQVLRDVDQGFWQFCTSYNLDSPVLPPSRDPVTKSFLHLDPFPWNETEPGHWARFGIADPNLLVAVQVNALRRPWLKAPSTEPVAGTAGYLYDATFCARNQREFNYSRFLEATEHVHKRLCHICIDGPVNTLRITVPAVLGATAVVEIFAVLVKAAENALTPPATRSGEVAYRDRLSQVELFAESCPEYVLGPANPLTFLAPEMPCSFFRVD